MKEPTRYNKICDTHDLPRVYCHVVLADTLAPLGANQDVGFGLLLQHFAAYSLLVGRERDKQHVMLMLFFVESIFETRNFEDLASSPFSSVEHRGVNYGSITDELIAGLLEEPTLRLG